MPKVRIDVTTDLHGTPGKIDHTSKSLDQMRGQAIKGGSAMKGLWKQFAGGLIAVGGLNALLRGAKGLISSFMDVGIEVEQYKLRLKGLLGSQAAAERAFDFFQKTAAKVPYTLQEVIATGVKISTVTDEFEKWLIPVADAAAAMGMELPLAADNMVRAFSSGLGAADMFREYGISPLIKEYAKLKYGINDLSKVSLPMQRKAMYEALTDTEYRFAGATERLAKSWKGMITMMRDALFRFREMVMKAGVFDYLKDKLKDLLKKVDDLTKSGKLEEWAKEAAEGFLNLLEYIEDLIPKIVKVGKVAAEAIRNAKTSTEDFSNVMKGKGIQSIDTLKKIRENLKKWGKDTTDLDIAIAQLDIQLHGHDRKIKKFSKETEKAAKSFSIKLNPALFDAEGKVKALKKPMEDAWKQFENLEIATQDAGEYMGNFSDETEGGSLSTISLAEKLGLLPPAYNEAAGAAKKAAATISESFSKALSTIGSFLQVLSDEIKDTGDKIIPAWKENLGNLVSFAGLALDQIGNNFKALRKEGKSTGAALLESIGPVLAGKIGGALGQLVSGAKKSFASLGASIGSAIAMIPGIGTAAGIAISAIGGLLGGLFKKGKSEAQKAAEDMQRRLSAMVNYYKTALGAISETTAKKMVEMSKTMPGYVAEAKILNEILAETGINTDNLKEAAGRMLGVLDQWKNKAISTTEAQKSLGGSFKILLDNLDSLGVEGTKQIVKIIQRTREFGLNVKEVTDYVTGQLDRIPSALTTLVQSYDEVGGSVEDMGALALHTFDSMVASGVSWMDAVKKMKEPLVALRDKYKELGIQSDGTLDQLFRIIDITNKHKSLFKAIDANKEVLEALGNTGWLTQGAMKTLTDQATSYYEQLKQAGMTSDDALRAMGPTLQNIQNYASAYGLEIDDNTQKLIDQATQIGVVKAVQEDSVEVQKRLFRELGDRMWKIMERVGDRIESAITGGFDRAFGTAKQNALDAANSIKDGLIGGFNEAFQAATDESWRAREKIRGNFESLGSSIKLNFDAGKTGGFQHEGIAWGPQLAWVGERRPEAIVDIDKFNAGVSKLSGVLKGPVNRSEFNLNINSPLIQTTGLSRADLESAGQEFYSIIQQQLRRLGKEM